MEPDALRNVANSEGHSYMALRKLEYGTTKFTEVFSCDEKGIGGAYHVYMIKRTPEEGDKKKGEVLGIIQFQVGALKEADGVNGIFIEDLLVIVRDRLECFQAGPYRCDENEAALESVKESLHFLKARTMNRQAKGILGTHIVG